MSIQLVLHYTDLSDVFVFDDIEWSRLVIVHFII